MAEELAEQQKWTQWQAIQLKSIRQFRRGYTRTISRTFQEVIPEIDTEIEKAFHKGSTDFEEQRAEAYRKAGKEVPHKYLPTYRPAPNLTLKGDWERSMGAAELVAPSDDTFFQINKPKMDAVLSELKDGIESARFAAARRMGTIHEEIIQKADLYFQTGTMTLNQAVDLAVKEMAAQGLNCIEYGGANPRRVNLTTYIEMALRTASRRSTLAAEGAKRDELEEWLVTSPVLDSTCPSCAFWQGQILIDDVFAHGKPDGKHSMLSTAMQSTVDGKPSHFLGPNCRHPVVTYFEGISQIPRTSDEDKTERNYNTEKRQRQIEVKIRQWKRIAASVTTDEERAKANDKVKAWQTRLKMHLRANPQLRRNPEREKITEFMLSNEAISA